MKVQTVIITGASSGIGKGIAKKFIEKGHQVVMNSSHQDRLQLAYKELGSPESAILVAGDVSDPQTGRNLVLQATQHFGSLDTLINNAGVFGSKPFLEVVPADLEHYMNINLKGTFFTSQAAMAHMKDHGGGNIINIGTVLVDHAIAGFPASAPITSKGAIHALTGQLAAEFGAENIRVNTIAPGIIRSPLQAKIGIENADDLAGLHLLQRIGEPEDVANGAYYLSTAEFVTGLNLDIAGGHAVGHKFG